MEMKSAMAALDDRSVLRDCRDVINRTATANDAGKPPAAADLRAYLKKTVRR
jgi:hypothetical protein